MFQLSGFERCCSRQHWRQGFSAEGIYVPTRIRIFDAAIIWCC